MMTKLLKTNTAAENLELVRACKTAEEMAELLNTATVKMLLEFNEILNAYAKKSDKKHEIINRIVSRLLNDREVEAVKKMSVDERTEYLIANEKSQLNIFVHFDIDELKALVQALKISDEEVQKYFCECPYCNEVDKYIDLILNKLELLRSGNAETVEKFEVGATYEKEYEVIARTDNAVVFKSEIGNFLRGVISIHDDVEIAKIGIDNYFLNGAEEILSARMKTKPAREISLDEAEENLNDAIVELKELENSDHSLDDLKKYDFPDDDYDNYSHLIVPLRKVEEHRRIVNCLSNYFDELEKNSDDDIPQIMSELESKTPEEQEKILESCSNDFLEDMCLAFGYKPNEDKKIMASLLARSQKSVQAKIQSIKEFLSTARENFNFFTHIDKKEQAESYSLCIKRSQALLSFYQQELIRSNKL